MTQELHHVMRQGKGPDDSLLMVYKDRQGCLAEVGGLGPDVVTRKLYMFCLQMAMNYDNNKQISNKLTAKNTSQRLVF